jgi:predicted DNA-binding protein
VKAARKSLDRMLRESRRRLGRELGKRTGKQQERFLRECVERAYAEMGDKPLWARVKRVVGRRRRPASA